MTRQFPPARPPQSSKPRKGKPRLRVPPHDFERDHTVPPDWKGRLFCRRCGKPGEVGDLQHPVGALPMPSLLPPVAPEVLEVEARRLGERHNDEAA